MTATPNPRLPYAIFGAGALCATIDIVYACSFHYIASGTPPLRILQSIASGLLGPAAFHGGVSSAALGLVAHYVILIVAAALYAAAAATFPVLLRRAWLAGIVFGFGIWLTMNFAVLPLSAAPRFTSTPTSFYANLAVHVLVLGPVIALSLSYLLRRRSHH